MSGELGRSALSAFFQTGDVPTQSQFKDLVVSTANLKDDNVYTGSNTFNDLKLTGSLSAIHGFSFSGDLTANSIVSETSAFKIDAGHFNNEIRDDQLPIDMFVGGRYKIKEIASGS